MGLWQMLVNNNYRTPSKKSIGADQVSLGEQNYDHYSFLLLLLLMLLLENIEVCLPTGIWFDQILQTDQLMSLHNVFIACKYLFIHLHLPYQDPLW